MSDELRDAVAQVIRDYQSVSDSETAATEIVKLVAAAGDHGRHWHLFATVTRVVEHDERSFWVDEVLATDEVGILVRGRVHDDHVRHLTRVRLFPWTSVRYVDCEVRADDDRA